MSILEMKNIVKKFGDTYAINDVSLTVEKGDVISIIGPSGSGKSTLLRCINHLETVNEGTITIDGEDIVTDGKYTKEKDIRRICEKTGMVFQGFNLFPHLTVLKNITIAQEKIFGIDKQTAINTARDLLNKVELSDKDNSYPAQLSGGQQQRVAIARALAIKPELMLFDEPTSALDPELTGEVLKVIQNLAKEKTTMIVVTHEMSFAKNVANKVIFMDKGEILSIGTPEEVFDNNENERIVSFLSGIKKD